MRARPILIARRLKLPAQSRHPRVDRQQRERFEKTILIQFGLFYAELPRARDIRTDNVEIGLRGVNSPARAS